MNIALICAMARNFSIGKDNKLPWHLSEDLKNFRRITTGHCIIMGRNTWESIGRPLPNRVNIVISSRKKLPAEGAIVVPNLAEAIATAQSERKVSNADKVFVIGGARVYAEAMALADEFFLTRVHAEVPGDTFLEGFYGEEWTEVSRENFSANTQSEFDYSICHLIRSQSSNSAK
ncbi:dihydrofolate reductase [OM182 bacterium]|jgi:dihydrofolate reductase|nr:dihydrofolate reductase [OM182 bacterium]